MHGSVAEDAIKKVHGSGCATGEMSAPSQDTKYVAEQGGVSATSANVTTIADSAEILQQEQREIGKVETEAEARKRLLVNAPW